VVTNRSQKGLKKGTGSTENSATTCYHWSGRLDSYQRPLTPHAEYRKVSCESKRLSVTLWSQIHVDHRLIFKRQDLFVLERLHESAHDPAWKIGVNSNSDTIM
jgi:hypothetical protein